MVILFITVTIGIRHGMGTVWLMGTGTGIISFHRRTIPIWSLMLSTGRRDLTIGRLTLHSDRPAYVGL